MNLPRLHSWNILFQSLAGTSRSVFILISGLLLLASSTAHATIDFNDNGASDLWEKQHNNGQLFSTFDPQADPDGDGWTNEIEAISGTDPFDGNPPTGCIRPEITHIPAVYVTGPGGEPEILTPEAITITWPTLAGKQYTLLASLDLTPGSWIPLDDGGPRISNGAAMGNGMTLPDDSPRLFLRVAVEDADSDFDLLTDFEEHALGTNPFNAYSDSDFLSDTFEVFQAGSDPASSDTDNNGIPDHGEPALLAVGQAGAGGNSYAPMMEWWGHTRAMTYHYSENAQAPHAGAGSLFTDAYWDGVEGVYSESPTRRPLGSLQGTLNAAAPFPTDKSTGPNYMYPISSFCSTFAHTDHVILHEKQVRLFASRPTETAITRRLMVLRYLDHSSGIPGNIEAYSFTIPAAGIVSPPQFFGQDYVPADRAYQFLDFYTPLFLGSTELGWDDTGSDPWCAVNVGEASTVRMTLGVPPPALPLLEIAVPTAYATYISLSENAFPLTNGNFKITGLSPTSAAGAEVVLRLKAAPTTIFAVMKVHVFAKREVPVTLFRIHDSREPESQMVDPPGINVTEMFAALNETYNPQGNIHFTLDRDTSGTVDIKKVPGDIFNAPERFDENGHISHEDLEAVHNLVRDIKGGNQNDTRLTIYLARGFKEANVGGAAEGGIHACMLPHTSARQPKAKEIYAHEIGHCLALAFKNAGPKGKHDLGPFPVDWTIEPDPKKRKVGLMFTSAEPSMTRWIRMKDWENANAEAFKIR